MGRLSTSRSRRSNATFLERDENVNASELLLPKNTLLNKFGHGYASMFAPEHLTVGLYLPIKSFEGPEPAMRNQIELAQRAECLGFTALWARDVPLNDPNFGDLGQIFDPFVWLAIIAAHTSTISLATGAVV